MATPINTVPLGRAGTGSAFVLGESQAANNLLNTLQYNQQINQKQEELRQQQAQQMAANWQKNQLKVDGGLYWQPEFNKRYQGHLEKGIQLRQMGIDPFNYNANDPNQAAIAQDYLLERQGILSDVDTRKALEANVGKQFGLVKGNPSKYYASDIANLNKYVETPFTEASKMQPPTLTERFDPNTLLKTISPAQVGSEIVVGNKKIKSVKALPQETRTAIVSAYTNSPATQRWVDELTGGQGFTIPQLERIPNSRESIERDLKAQYDGNPQLRTQLASQGVIGKDSEGFKRFVNSETDRLYSAKNKWNNQIQSDLNQVLPKVKQMESVLPDYSSEDQAMQRERLAIARRTESRLATGGGDNSAAVQPISIPFGKGNSKGVVDFEEYVPLTLTKKNFAGSEYIDLKTGKPGGKLNPSNDYEVVGVGNAPFITKGNFKGSISQPDFARNNPNVIEKRPIIHVQTPASGDTPAKDYFVPYNRLPDNVKNSKSVREALSKFKPATVGAPSKSNKQQSNSDPLGIL